MYALVNICTVLSPDSEVRESIHIVPYRYNRDVSNLVDFRHSTSLLKTGSVVVLRSTEWDPDTCRPSSPKRPTLICFYLEPPYNQHVDSDIIFFCNPFFTSKLEDSLLQFQNRCSAIPTMPRTQQTSRSYLIAQARTFPGLFEIFQRPPSVQKFHLPIFSLCLAFPPVPYFDEHLECFFLNAHILTWIQGSRGCIQ